VCVIPVDDAPYKAFAGVREDSVVDELSGRQILDAVHEGTVRTRALLAAQTAEVVGTLAAYLEQALAGHRNGGGYIVPMPAIIGSGAKP